MLYNDALFAAERGTATQAESRSEAALPKLSVMHLIPQRFLEIGV